MSGVYIPGMQMPKNRAVYIAIDNGDVFIKPLGSLHWAHLDKKVVEIPDHGRPIDAVMLRHKCYQHYEDFMLGKIDGKTALLNIEKEIIDAPAIIPADKEEEA